MTHKVSLNSLVIDYKRSAEGKGVLANNALTCLVAFSLAYSAKLPDNGRNGAAEASSTLLRPILNTVISDVNELMMVDLGQIIAMTEAFYVNRYEHAWGQYRALESFRPRQIVEDVYGDSCWETITLWAGRFLEAVDFYVREVKGEAA